MNLRYIQRDILLGFGNMGGSSELYDSKLIEKAKKDAKRFHDAVNQKYDGENYFDTHIMSVFNLGLKYIHLVPWNYRTDVLIGLLFHDSLEDANVTYGDIKKLYGEKVADIAYALTNDKGKTREERAGAKYYRGIRNTPYATFVKIMDRLSNVAYSKSKGSVMYRKYILEMPKFVSSLKGTDTLFGKAKVWVSTITGVKGELDYDFFYTELMNYTIKNKSND